MQMEYNDWYFDGSKLRCTRPTLDEHHLLAEASACSYEECGLGIDPFERKGKWVLNDFRSAVPYTVLGSLSRSQCLQRNS